MRIFTGILAIVLVVLAIIIGISVFAGDDSCVGPATVANTVSTTILTMGEDC